MYVCMYVYYLLLSHVLSPGVYHYHSRMMAAMLTCNTARTNAAEDRYDCNSQRVLSTYIVESRISQIGITLMVWVSVPHIGT